MADDKDFIDLTSNKLLITDETENNSSRDANSNVNPNTVPLTTISTTNSNMNVTMTSTNNKEVDNQYKPKLVQATELSALLQEIMKSCPIKSLTLKASEMVSFQTCIKRYYIDGRVCKSLQPEYEKFKNYFTERISQCMGQDIDIEEFWKATCGYSDWDKFESIEVSDFQGEKFSICHENGTLLILDIWAMWPKVKEYFLENTKFLTKLFEGKIEGVPSDKVKRIGISGLSEFVHWKNIVTKLKCNENMAQYYSESIYEELDIKECPTMIIIDTKGTIRYFGMPAEVDMEQTIKNLLQEGDVAGECSIVKKPNEEDRSETNPNPWWMEMDDPTRIDIVRNINISLHDLGVKNTFFAVMSNFTYVQDHVKIYSLPVFMGTVLEAEYEILQNYAVELQTNWNFSNFQFQVQVFSFV